MIFRVFDWEKSKKIQIDLDELVLRITASNIKESANLETVKCFAIMARTELARKMKLYKGRGCIKNKGSDICTEPGHCLECGIANMETPIKDFPLLIRKAVEETKNKIITFEGKPIKAYFHYRCGGSTENSENVLGNKITYLRKVYCKYCNEEDELDKHRCYTIKELEKLLNIKMIKPEKEYYKINGMFEKVEVDEEDRIKSITIGGKSFKGTEIMELLKLNSTRFNYTPIKFLISSIGKGHGLGLCYIGSINMAKSGMKFEDILSYYYTGIKIEEMQLPDINKPLKGVLIVLDAASGLGDIKEAQGQSGLKEGEVNLLIVLELEKLLLQSGAEVFLTRKGKDHISLTDRAQLANEKKPNIFLSIGQNTFQNPTATGTEIYHYTDDKEARELSQLIIEEISKSINSKCRGIMEVEFYLLREIRCSAVLIELLYISNPKDEKKLADPLIRKKAAYGIYRAIIKHHS